MGMKKMVQMINNALQNYSHNFANLHDFKESNIYFKDLICSISEMSNGLGKGEVICEVVLYRWFLFQPNRYIKIYGDLSGLCRQSTLCFFWGWESWIMISYHWCLPPLLPLTTRTFLEKISILKTDLKI